MKNLIKLEVDFGDNNIDDNEYSKIIDSLINLKKLKKMSLILENNLIKYDEYNENFEKLR